MKQSPLFRKTAAVTIIAMMAILWVVASSGQDIRPTPGLGTGMVTVRGTVDIGNSPVVNAVQGGEWNVTVSSPAEVRVISTPTLDFVKQGGRYRVSWPAGQTESIVVAQPGPGAWMRVESAGGAGRRRWINLAGAQAIEEATK